MRTAIWAMILAASPAFAGGEVTQGPANACYYDGKVFSNNALIRRDGAKTVCNGTEWKEARDSQCAYDGTYYSQGATIALANGGSSTCEQGNWVDSSCHTYNVGNAPIALSTQPQVQNWEVCMQYDAGTDGPEAGAMVITVRDLVAPTNGPHQFEDVIKGYLPNGSETKTQSCMSVTVGPNQVLAGVKSAGSGPTRKVQVCPAKM